MKPLSMNNWIKLGWITIIFFAYVEFIIFYNLLISQFNPKKQKHNRTTCRYYAFISEYNEKYNRTCIDFFSLS